MVVNDLVEELKKLEKNEFLDEAIMFLERGNLKWVDTDSCLVSCDMFLGNEVIRDSLSGNGFSACDSNVEIVADELEVADYLIGRVHENIQLMLNARISELDAELDEE